MIEEEPRDIEMEIKSPVSNMFDGRSVLITGSSGFIGRVLLEKLLSSYGGIKRIYILLRSKKNVSARDRLHKQLLAVPIFDRIRARSDGDQILNKIYVMPGDIGEPWLGLSQADIETLITDQSLSIIFHSAATIKFDEPLKASIKLNLIATRTLIKICRQLPNLISFCHVSTAYVNSDIIDNSWIEEKLYPMRDSPEKLINLAELMDESLMQELKGQLVGNKPNTYTYTKSLAEHLIANEGAGLPIAIVRPSIVVASWQDPLPGWIDNLNGPTGLVIAIGKGLLRSMHAKREVKAEIVPVDIVVNTMIASAYYIAKSNNKLSIEPETSELELEKNQDVESLGELPIIHCNSGDLNPVTWGQLEDQAFPIIRHYPSHQVLRYPFGSFKSNKYHDALTRLFVHILPALILDMICGLFGKKRQLFNIYRKLHSAVFALSHFCTHNYNFRSKNMKILEKHLNETDRKFLNMRIEDMHWLKYWEIYVLGARRYILKEEDHTLEESRKSLKRALYIEYALRFILLAIAASVCLPIARVLLLH